jgi:NitT/TauT family transport system permease protein
MLDLFRPNRNPTRSILYWWIALQFIFLILAWLSTSSVFFPKPTEIISAYYDLWFNEGLGIELLTSLTLYGQSLLIATTISLLMAYSTVIAACRPSVNLVGKFRFLPMIGISFFFTLMTHSGHSLKVSLEVFSILVFFSVSMVDVVDSIPQSIYDLARTLRMNEWHVVWEVVIKGQMSRAFDALRQNAAIGWLMLTMVEGLSRSEGGIGAMMLNENKHFHLPAVFAIQLIILVVGLMQDYAIGYLRNLCCPYALLTVERR